MNAENGTSQMPLFAGNVKNPNTQKLPIRKEADPKREATNAAN